MNFGERLREMRKEKGLTLREVAERAGIDFTYLSKIENERIPYTPAVETIRQLADALSVDSIELLTLAGSSPKNWRRSGETSRPGDISIAQRR